MRSVHGHPLQSPSAPRSASPPTHVLRDRAARMLAGLKRHMSLPLIRGPGGLCPIWRGRAGPIMGMSRDAGGNSSLMLGPLATASANVCCIKVFPEAAAGKPLEC
jgi:hypothetical protein